MRFVCERFLHRLGASELRERCTLKGAGLLTLWMQDPYRSTRDVDLLAVGKSDAATVRANMETICRVPCPQDGLRFELESLSVRPIRDKEKYAGLRALMRVCLGKARVRLQNARWRAYRKEGHFRPPPPERLGEVCDRIRDFLGPVRESIVAGTPFPRFWPAGGGGWRPAAYEPDREAGDV